MLAVPQASMRSIQRRVQGLALSPFEPGYLFQPSSTVKRSFAGRGIYIGGFSVPEGKRLLSRINGGVDVKIVIDEKGNRNRASMVSA